MLEPVSWAIKPMILKMTNPAKILVAQFNIGTIRASLKQAKAHLYYYSGTVTAPTNSAAVRNSNTNDYLVFSHKANIKKKGSQTNNCKIHVG